VGSLLYTSCVRAHDCGMDENFHDPATLTDEQVNQSRRFAGLPPLDAKEMKAWRGYLRWMQERFGGRRPSSGKPPQS
jgi:hypothetical protein